MLQTSESSTRAESSLLRRVHLTVLGSAWDELERTGTLRFELALSALPCFSWLTAQLARRLPGYSRLSPCIGQSDAHAASSLHLFVDPGTRIHLVEAVVPASRVLELSQSGWHCVVTGSYLALDEQEERCVEQHEPDEATLHASWERAFDLRACADWFAGDQAMLVIDGIRREEIVDAISYHQPAYVWAA